MLCPISPKFPDEVQCIISSKTYLALFYSVFSGPLWHNNIGIKLFQPPIHCMAHWVEAIAGQIFDTV